LRNLDSRYPHVLCSGRVDNRGSSDQPCRCPRTVTFRLNFLSWFLVRFSSSGSGYRTHGEHRVLNITGKGNKERTTPLHLEAVERLGAWLALPGSGDGPAAPLFRPQRSARNHGRMASGPNR
jgi:hypothetical protein